MSSKEEEDVITVQRPPSPPAYRTFSTRGITPPDFPTLRPRETRINSSFGMNHIAWNCNGKKLAAVGIDKIARVWLPEKSIEYRAASTFSGGHTDDIDYVNWNPAHPDLFCTSSARDRRIVFWDARQTKYTQSVSLKVSPTSTTYSPTGKSLLYTSSGNQLYSLVLGRGSATENKETWTAPLENLKFNCSRAIFNWAGTALAVVHSAESQIRIVEWPSLVVKEALPAHVGGCTALALHPGGKYLASGGLDSIVNLFDVEEWICVRTISTCDNAITCLSFSHDGEYLAVASSGSYIDICATETAAPLYRLKTAAPSPVVAWSPAQNAIAYCGQTFAKEGGTAPMTFIGLFGAM